MMMMMMMMMVLVWYDQLWDSSTHSRMSECLYVCTSVCLYLREQTADGSIGEGRVRLVWNTITTTTVTTTATAPATHHSSCCGVILATLGAIFISAGHSAS